MYQLQVLRFSGSWQEQACHTVADGGKQLALAADNMNNCCFLQNPCLAIATTLTFMALMDKKG